MQQQSEGGQFQNKRCSLIKSCYSIQKWYSGTLVPKTDQLCTVYERRFLKAANQRTNALHTVSAD